MGEPTASIGRRTRWYLPTTRNNTIGMLSGGITAPAQGLPKHYEDIQSVSPARTLLTSCGACRGWYRPTYELKRDLPAIIELDVAVDGDTLTHADTTILSCDVAVPISRVTTVHLATQVHADEFVARRYDNFDPSAVDVAVSPALFYCDLPSMADLQTWLGSLGGQRRDVLGELQSVDSFGGALTMLLACPAQAITDLIARTAIFDRLLRATTPSVFDSLAVVEWMSPDIERERMLLRATMSVLTALAPVSRLGSRRTLATIRDLIERDQRLDDTLTANLDRIDSILRSARELKPFSRNTGLRSAKALLLFLLRPSPDATLTWVHDMPDDTLSVLGACVLSGATAGARSIPTSVRRPEFAHLVAEAMADHFNSDARAPIERFTDLGGQTVDLGTAGANDSTKPPFV